MNSTQNKAAEKLRKALNECHAARLQGGVYDGSFCIWPSGGDPHKASEFFKKGVEDLCNGKVLYHVKMHLDGGAGN